MICPDWSTEPKMPIIKGELVQSIPLEMLYPFREKAMLYYGRTLEGIAERRGGLTALEALELIRPENIMPPKHKTDIQYQAILSGELELFYNLQGRGLAWGPDEDKPIDYSDCRPIVLKGYLAHLKYVKTVRNLAEIEKDARPLVLYLTTDTCEVYSFENGVTINRMWDIFAVGSASTKLGEALPPVKTPDFESSPTCSQVYSELMLLRHRIATLFDAIKHGVEDRQAWLQEAITCHFKNDPLPEYVPGKNKTEQQVTEFFKNIRTEQKPLFAETQVQVKRPIQMVLLGWRIDWPTGGIGMARWCGADDWKTKDRLVSIGGVAVELWGDPAKAPSSGPAPWPVLGKEYRHREDEPFFVLLGRDPQAPGILEHWADVRAAAEPGDWKIESARQLARDMRVFKAANPDFGMSSELYVKAAATWFEAVRGQQVKLSDDVILQRVKTLYNDAVKELQPKRVTVNLDDGTPPHPGVVKALAILSQNAPEHIDLALQLVNAQPCSTCGYIHTRCRCVKEDKPAGN